MGNLNEMRRRELFILLVISGSSSVGSPPETSLIPWGLELETILLDQVAQVVVSVMKHSLIFSATRLIIHVETAVVLACIIPGLGGAVVSTMS